MAVLASALFLLISTVAPKATPPADVFAPLNVYRGTWKATPSLSGTGSDTIHNDCHRFPAYFACQQTVNGNAGALVVYLYDGSPGRYTTNGVLPNGVIGAPGHLQIVGNRWTFLNTAVQNGTTHWYRTTNVFHGADAIHFEIAHSSDNKTWVIDRQGDESRTSN